MVLFWPSFQAPWWVGVLFQKQPRWESMVTWRIPQKYVEHIHFLYGKSHQKFMRMFLKREVLDWNGGGAWTKHLLINGDLQSCLPGSGVYFYILCWQSIPLVWSVGCLGVISWLLGCHQLANTLLGLAFGWSLPTVYSHRFCRFVSFCIRAKVHQWKFSDNDILQHPQVMISSYFLQKILCSHYKF